MKDDPMMVNVVPERVILNIEEFETGIGGFMSCMSTCLHYFDFFGDGV